MQAFWHSPIHGAHRDRLGYGWVRLAAARLDQLPAPRPSGFFF
jgi:hypothetical protein